MDARQTNADNIAAPGAMLEIGQCVHEIPRTILVGWQHADAFNLNRQQHEPVEKQKAGDN